MRTVVYIDGYNLYYGLLRGTKFKWLDVVVLFQEHVLDSAAELVDARYYTAPVLARKWAVASAWFILISGN